MSDPKPPRWIVEARLAGRYLAMADQAGADNPEVAAACRRLAARADSAARGRPGDASTPALPWREVYALPYYKEIAGDTVVTLQYDANDVPWRCYGGRPVERMPWIAAGLIVGRIRCS